MLPYWILFAVFAIGTIQFRYRPEGIARGGPLFVLAAVATSLMIGLRYYVGGDWGSYDSLFNGLGYFTFADAVRQGDPGYAAINWIINRIGLRVWAVNLICSIIFMYGLTVFAKRQPNPWAAILVAVPYLIIVIAMGYTRQAVAIGLIMFGMTALERGNLPSFIVSVVLAATFHKTAIIVIPLVGLAAARRRSVIIVALIPTVALLYYLLLRQSVDSLMSNYVHAQYQSRGAAIRVFMNIPPATIMLLVRRRIAENEAQFRIWLNFSIASFVALALLLLTPSSTAVDRMALYLIPIQMFVFSRIAWLVKGGSKSRGMILLALIAYCGAIQFTWLNFAYNASSWLPFRIYAPFLAD